MRINFNPNVQVPNFGKIVVNNDDTTKKLIQNKRFEKVIEMLSDISGDEIYRCSLINRRHGYCCVAVFKDSKSKNGKGSMVIYANDTAETLKERVREKKALNYHA